MYELWDKEGRLAPIVLKATRRGALISDNKREWAAGQRLGALGPGDAPLPGIMKIGPAVCRGRKRANSKGSKLMGMRNLYVCMYVCSGVCMYVCMYLYVCMYVCMFWRMYVCMYFLATPSSWQHRSSWQ